MTIKQKMIEAMSNAHQRWLAGGVGDPLDPSEYMLDAALDVLADPENWTDEMQQAADLVLAGRANHLSATARI